jgi:hypothetical protein
VNEQKVFPFRAQLAKGTGSQRSERTGWLTPYEVETLFADALWAGRGAQLELRVPARTSDAGVDWIRQRFDRLRKRGIGVRVRRDDAWTFNEVVRLGS